MGSGVWGVGFGVQGLGFEVLGLRVEGFTPATTASSTFFRAYAIPPAPISPNYIAQCMGGQNVHGFVGEGAERETTGYEPFAVHAPIQWALPHQRGGFEDWGSGWHPGKHSLLHLLPHVRNSAPPLAFRAKREQLERC